MTFPCSLCVICVIKFNTWPHYLYENRVLRNSVSDHWGLSWQVHANTDPQIVSEELQCFNKVNSIKYTASVILYLTTNKQVKQLVGVFKHAKKTMNTTARVPWKRNCTFLAFLQECSSFFRNSTSHKHLRFENTSWSIKLQSLYCKPLKRCQILTVKQVKTFWCKAFINEELWLPETVSHYSRPSKWQRMGHCTWTLTLH